MLANVLEHDMTDSPDVSVFFVAGYSSVSPKGLFIEFLPLCALDFFEVCFPQCGKIFQSLAECLVVCPAISFHKTFNIVEKVLDFIPSFRVLQVVLDLVFGKVVWAVPLVP